MRALKPGKKWGEDLHYRALFEQTSECVFIIGLDFCYLAANRQALKLLGYEEDELIGMPVAKVMSQDDALGHESLFSDNETRLYERVLQRKDGITLPVEISTSIVYDDMGEPSYIQSIARDISERKNAERALKRHTQNSFRDRGCHCQAASFFEHRDQDPRGVGITWDGDGCFLLCIL